ncbi:Glu-tRNA(Gln) amidotransferase GatDE subunit E [Candidatus Woesearchaeota archaeon]|nr:MAG: Glu-tRNA(Gln) amidotransferase GatDE subunit E [Candidatus Woesearchaeota archaeon]
MVKPKIGLEIHQQLDTGKLFCSCPSIISDREPDFIVKRFLRASRSEMGELDKAALHEVLREKEFHYYGYYDTTCLVELDEEPPHDINKEALNIALNVAKLLNAKIVDRVVVMRKIVLDGSNTAGFQRTALVGYDGYITLKGKRIGIPTICLEEDAAKIVKRTPKYDIYNLSRLGIPLIEISTTPDIESGEVCREVAEHIGMILRSMEKVKRGLGTIRQDVNVSIPRGARVEIKGAQDLRLLNKLVDYEIMRQTKLIAIKDRLTKLSFSKPIDLTHLFKNTGCKLVAGVIKQKGNVFGMRVSNSEGLFGLELQPGKRVGTELAEFGRVKVGIGGLFHSDELPKYGITAADIKNIRKELNCKDGDGFVLIADKKETAVKGLEMVKERLKQLSQGVPSEVRKANPDATTSYLRPMPGRARMYPETDLPLIKPEFSQVKKARLLTELAKELEMKYGLSKDLAKLTVKSPKVDSIVKLIKRYDSVKPSFIAETVLKAEKEIRKEYKKEIKLSDDVFEKVFDALNQAKITKENLLTILAHSDTKDVDKLIEEMQAGVSDSELEGVILKAISQNKDASFNALMGIVMAKLRGRVSGSKVAQMLKKHLK